MRQFPMALILVLVLCAPALGQSSRGAGGALFDQLMQSKCSKPDSALIKPGTSDAYNAQAKGFNDCLRIYVENENAKIQRMRVDAGSQIDVIMAGAVSQIRDIERAIDTAIIEVDIVKGASQPGEMPPPREGLASFPAAECARPDEALLKPVRGKKAASLASLDRYEEQFQGYKSCLRLYIVQAKNQIGQVKANAEAGIKAVADDANPRIHQININVSVALDDAIKASGERNAKVNVIHAPLAVGGLDPAGYQAGGVLSSVSFQPLSLGTQSVTVTGEKLPRSADMPTGEGDPDTISCRKPQQLADSRLMGPEICKHNRVWADLYKAGKTISADGQKIVESEKGQTLGPSALKC
jgi:hypothetical protein